MAHINLLPWREEALKVQQREFFTILTVVALLTFALIFSVSLYYQSQVDGQRARNQFLKNEIQILDIKIAEIRTLRDKKTALQKRISVIEQLQRSRNVGTQVLDEMARVIPNGIYITELEKKGNEIFLRGKSESNNHLANMIRAIELSDLFSDATPESIVTDEKATKLLSDFKMKLRIKGLVDDLDAAAEEAFQGGR
jgi:type IV pilus assembly protein PilN